MDLTLREGVMGSSYIMTLGSTQSLGEMSPRNLPVGKQLPTCKTDYLTAIGELTVSKIWEPQCLKPYGPPWPVAGITL
jgi:hypothetical protein